MGVIFCLRQCIEIYLWHCASFPVKGYWSWCTALLFQCAARKAWPCHQTSCCLFRVVCVCGETSIRKWIIALEIFQNEPVQGSLRCPIISRPHFAFPREPPGKGVVWVQPQLQGLAEWSIPHLPFACPGLARQTAFFLTWINKDSVWFWIPAWPKKESKSGLDSKIWEMPTTPSSFACCGDDICWKLALNFFWPQNALYSKCSFGRHWALHVT